MGDGVWVCVGTSVSVGVFATVEVGIEVSVLVGGNGVLVAVDRGCK